MSDERGSMGAKGVTVLATLAAAIVSGGWLLERGAIEPNRVTAEQGTRLFRQVLERVAQDFVEPVSPDTLWRKAASGLLRQLRDPHSSLLSERALDRLNERTTGNYGGLGVQVDVRDGWLTVTAPLPNSPASEAGLETGDRIVSVDGRNTFGLSIEEALRTLRGAPGSSAKLEIDRPGVGSRMTFTLTRRVVHQRAVRRASLLEGGVGYVEVATFSDSTSLELARAIDSLARAGMTSLMLDLRGNPGGLLEQGVEVTELFLDPGQAIVRMKGRTPEANREFMDREQQRWRTLPIVTLVDEGSASAAEIVAGALQDHDRAVLVGAPTYGKGSAQSVFRIPGEGAVKLTTSLWYTPAGRSINRRPIDADGDDDGEPTDSIPLAKRAKFRTDMGRVVYGGGGILPDVVVADTLLAGAEREFERALGEDVPRFRDALTDYALSLRAQRAVRDPLFAVTPAMREALWQRMTQRGIAMPRDLYDRNAPLVDRALGIEIARYVLGAEAEFRRGVRDDPTLATATSLARGATGMPALLARADSARKVHERAARGTAGTTSSNE
jgi:carboxyl-terminal processing protease